MAMTKSDYELIAAVISSIRGSNTECDQIADSLTWRFIGALETEYPRFNRETFKKACGYDDGDNWQDTWSKFQQEISK
jgi:hypothetical protein